MANHTSSYTRAAVTWLRGKVTGRGTYLRHPIAATRSSRKAQRMQRVRNTWPSAVNRSSYSKLRKRFGIP